MPGIEPGVAESGSMNADHCAKITYCTKLGQQLSPSHKQRLLSFSAARVCSSLSHKPLNEYVRAIFVTKNSLISGIRSQVLRATHQGPARSPEAQREAQFIILMT